MLQILRARSVLEVFKHREECDHICFRKIALLRGDGLKGEPEKMTKKSEMRRQLK